MQKLQKANPQHVLSWGADLHADLSDAQLAVNYTNRASEMGYLVNSVKVDRANQYAPSMMVVVHPVGKPNDKRTFTLVLLGNAANIGIVFKKDGEEQLLLRYQDKSASVKPICVPGGRADLTDSDIHETAKRELLEEVGDVKIPSGSKFWIDAVATAPVTNNAVTTDTTVLIWIDEASSEDFINSVDASKWGYLSVKEAAATVDHGPSNRAARNALIFQLGHQLPGTTGTV